MFIGRTLPEAALDMRSFDPLAVAKVAARELESLDDPRRRAILSNFIEHASAEACGDYERLMASCSRRRQSYTAWGAGADYAAHLPQDYAALEAHYRGLIASNTYLIHFDTEKLVVGQDELMVEGIVHQLYPAALVRPVFGFDPPGDAAVQQLSKRTCLVFLFDEDGLGCGEHAYSNGPTTVADFSPVPADLVPAAFWKNPLQQAR